jgi:hypothetical protein
MEFCIPIRRLNFALRGSFFDVYVLKFAGLKDFSALQAFHKFRVFVTADNLHAGVLAGLPLNYGLRRGGRLWGHNPERPPELWRWDGFRRISGILERLSGLSSP